MVTNLNTDKMKELLKRGCDDKINSESALRELVISQLLEAMGWSFDAGEWIPEKKVYFGSKPNKIDYEVGTKNDKFIIEAKKPGLNLNSDDFIRQLLSYMKLEDINYGFLFNGRELMAFKSDSIIPFYNWNCDNNDLEIFNMFSNGNFPHSIDKYINENKTLEKFKNYINNNQDLIKNEIIQKISELSETPGDTVKECLPNILDSLTKEPSDDANKNTYGNLPKTVFRKELRVSPEKMIAIFPAAVGDNIGVEWLLKYNAWRSVIIKENPEYFALYVSAPVSSVLYFAEIKEIRNVEDQSLLKLGIPPPDPEETGKGKKIIILRPESIVKLGDPIKMGERIHGLRKLMYSTMQKFVNASTLDDL